MSHVKQLLLNVVDQKRKGNSMLNDQTRMNGGGQPEGWGTPTVVDGSYKSNNKNLNVSQTSTVFDPTAEGIGSFNKVNYPASEPRPFSKA